MLWATFPWFVRSTVADDASSDGEVTADLGPGRVALIVGPSGAGKDAILAEVRRRLGDSGEFTFPRRVVTRRPDSAEEHDGVSQSEFAAELAAGRYALHWQAHGLSYGIPIEIDAAVGAGGCVVFNASRSVAASARRRYRHAAVVLIDAPAATRAARLAHRGREDGKEQAARLRRASDFSAADAELVIDNAGALTAAVETLAAWLMRWQCGSQAPNAGVERGCP